MVQITPPDQSTEDGTGTDGCNPFCSCSCCNLSITHPQLSFAITEESQTTPTKIDSAKYARLYTPTFDTSIWQPPKA